MRFEKKNVLYIYLFALIILLSSSSPAAVFITTRNLVDRSSFLVQGYAHRLFMDGKAFEFEGDLHKAQIQYQESFRLTPKSFDSDGLNSLIRHGQYFHFSGNFEEAIRIYELILDVQPQNAAVLFMQGVSVQNMGDIMRTSELYEKALSYDPQHFKSHLNLGALHHKYGSEACTPEN